MDLLLSYLVASLAMFFLSDCGAGGRLSTYAQTGLPYPCEILGLLFGLFVTVMYSYRNLWHTAP